MLKRNKAPLQGGTSIMVKAGADHRATVVALTPDGLAADPVYLEPGESQSWDVQHADGGVTRLEVSQQVLGKSPKTA